MFSRGRTAADRRFGGWTGRRLCVGGSYRAPCTEPRRGCTKSAPRSLGGQCVFHRRGRQRTTYRTWPTGPLRSASRIPDRGHRQRLARPSDARCPSVRTQPPRPAIALEVASPTGRSRRAVEREVPRHRLDFPGGDDIAPAVRARRRRRQPHVDREARQAPGAPSRPRLPPLGMHRRKMSADQPLVAHDAVPDSRSAAARPLRLGQPTRHRPQRPWPNRRLMDAPRPG